MYEVKITDLPKELGEDYLVIVSNSEIDLSNLDRILNIEGVITGLIDEYTYIEKSVDMTSILVKVDSDSKIFKSKLNSSMECGMYICDMNHYYEIVNSYRSNNESELDLSSRTYGYNDIKVLFKQLEKDIRVVIIAPFNGSSNVTDVMFNSLSNMFKTVYGASPIREYIDGSLSLITLRFKLPLDILRLHGRKNFDIFMNQLLAIINLDKFTSMESLSSSNEITNILNE